MARIPILFGFVAIVAFGCIINEAAARDVKLVRLPKIRRDALKMVGGEGKLNQGEIRMILFKAIETARDKLNDLKTLKTSNDLKDELDFLIKSEMFLKEMSKVIKNGTFSARQINFFIEKESSFYKVWKEKSYNAVVPEKEKEFMSEMRQITMLLKKTQKNM